MYKVEFWRMTSAETEVIESFERRMCPGDDGESWPCSYYPHLVLTWTVNTSGLPCLGEPRTDFTCYRHLAQRVGRIPFEYAGSVVITPYREVTE